MKHCLSILLTLVALLGAAPASPQTPRHTVAPAPRAAPDPRVRDVLYDPDHVYPLTGFAGYQIDLTFEPGESFVGLGAGDVEGLAFVAQDNHLFLKPRADNVSTNLTVLTTRRTYYFDYVAHALKPGARRPPMLYSLRFIYPPTAASRDAARIDKALGEADPSHPPNLDFWYCGAPSLRPLAAQDDGVHTRLRFGAHSELPAIFVQNDDGSESLINYSIEGDDVLVHRVVRRLILRRGQLTGCVVNKSFNGGGGRLQSGTVAPGVDRATRGEPHE